MTQSGSPLSFWLGVLLSATAALSRAAVANDLPIVHVLEPGLPAFIGTDAPSRVRFGQFLFQTRLLSPDLQASCSDCHKREFAFSAGLRFPEIREAFIGHRKTPPIFDLYYARDFMWDGRAQGLIQQVVLPLQSAEEINAKWEIALPRLEKEPQSVEFLRSEQKTSLDERDVISSLAAFVRSVVTAPSRFDLYYYRGEEKAIDDEEKFGLKLFVGKAHCSRCHLLSGDFALFTDFRFHSIGIGFDGVRYRDPGRFEVTRDHSDFGRFKTPSLRNISLTAPYMHDGSMPTIREVIEYYNKGGNRDALNLDDKVEPLGLTEREIRALIAFLGSLQSDLSLYLPDSGPD